MGSHAFLGAKGIGNTNKGDDDENSTSMRVDENCYRAAVDDGSFAGLAMACAGCVGGDGRLPDSV